MNLEAGDRVVKMAVATDKQAIAVVSNRGAFKWMPVTEISATSRGRKGVAIMRELKKDPHRIAPMMVVDVHEPTPLTVMTDRDKQLIFHQRITQWDNVTVMVALSLMSKQLVRQFACTLMCNHWF